MVELSCIVTAFIFSQTQSVVLTVAAVASLHLNLSVRLPKDPRLMLGFAIYEVFRHELGYSFPFLDLAGAVLRSKVYSEVLKPVLPQSPQEVAFLGVLTSAAFELGFSGLLASSTSMGLLCLHSLATTFLIQPYIQNKGLLILASFTWDIIIVLRNPLAVLFWVFDFRSLMMIPYWAVVSAMSLLGIHLVSKYLKWSQIIVRKLFHFMILALFLPSPNANFTVFASLLACKGLVIVEVLRSRNSLKFVSQFYSRFIDSRDLTNFCRTHLYLLIGNFLPLAISGSKGTGSGYLGMLSLGVGDSVASIVGSRYGKIHFPKSKKTIEGSLSSYASQLLAAGLLGLLSPKLAIILAIGTIYEAYTDQIDNLTLPIVCCSAYDLCSIFLNI